MEKQKQRGERRITPPSLEEWAMFEKCPEHHRQYCLDYEYCREPESKHIRKVITDWCGPDAASILETVLGNSAALYLHGKLPELCLPLADLLIRFPEFPEKSFLEIPEATRTERLPVVPSIEPLEGFKWENLVNEFGATEDFLEKDEGNELVAYSVFRISWRYSNPQLLEAFREWLVSMRKQRSDRQPYERRGRNELKTHLKQLGAKRLLDRMTWQAAQAFTMRFLTDKKGEPKPLYPGQSHWIDARRQARQHLANFITESLGVPG